MAIKLIADPHGYFKGLVGEVRENDTLLVLGDVLDLIDWADLSGILPEVLGKENLVERIFSAFAAGPEAAMAMREELLSLQGEYFQELLRRINDDYRRFTKVLREIGCRTYIIYGNSDMPEILESSLDGLHKSTLVEGRVELEGETFGFVPGPLYSPFKMPREIDDEEFGSRLEELGRVDVLCTHIPPRWDAALFDVVAERPVEGSEKLLEYIEREKPALVYHGHVHHPAQRAVRIGDTKVVNVAYYKRDKHVYRHGNEDEF
ncbi:MAG: metallophosphoesterase [Actinomycetota bacterium]|nr:metallophosphoesterase [Actinomycetota bacterium]